MRPMLATPGAIPRVEGWAYEVKWDGMRLLADVGADGSLRLFSRNETDVTAAFPELADLGGLGADLVLDGEAVALDEEGLPSFSRLSRRIGVRNPRRARALAEEIPITYVVFDLLVAAGQSTCDEPFRQRRERLAALTLPRQAVLSEVFDDGGALLAQTRLRGLEGVVAKRWDSRYRPGIRSADWIKHSHRSATDAVVIGWRESAGQAVSLLLAEQAPGGLVFRGAGGSGIDARSGRWLAQNLGPLELSAAPPVRGLDPAEFTAAGFRWCQPSVTVEVRHLGYSAGGRFRQPVIDRVRTDLAEGAGDGAGEGLAAQPRDGARDRAEGDRITVSFHGRRFSVSNLAKVLYPATGTTKAEVLEYYAEVAGPLLSAAHDRPVTRRRWPDGVAAPSFFEKNLPGWAPRWIRTVEIPGREGPTRFPVLSRGDAAGVVWLAAHSALELHTPQWRVGADGEPLPPDRMVIDLDPGPGVGLAECAQVARWAAERIPGPVAPVLSGSSGIHLYCSAPGPGEESVVAAARALARELAREHPDLVVDTMTKARRVGRVFIDWSQNRMAKTTVAPWSLRGTDLPNVAMPVTWEELAEPELRQRTLAEALDRVRAGDLPPLPPA